MSCNGCRVLRKGCSDSCILRPCLQWIESPEAQGHATVFVAKFFGRASLTSFISAVPENQRPALFQSLLYEACGRTVNPVFGAVGLLSSGNWSLCQAAVETVLRGGTLKPLPSASSSSPSIISSCAATPSVSAQSCKQASSTQRSMAAAAAVATVAPTPTATHAFVQPPPSLLHSKRPLSEASADLTTTITAATAGMSSLAPPPQLKRPRPAATTADRPQQLQHDIKSGNADLHHHGSILNPNLLAIKTEEEDEAEAHPPAGKLVAPVPRRVRPHTIDHYHYHTQTVARSAIQPSESRRPMVEASDNIELDLSLNSHANHDGLGANYPRVGSPCSMSVNSDCSVTSFELSCCPVRTPSPRQERQLLHLLL